MKRIRLAPGLEISRIVTGLWQIADMERDGRPFDPEAAATAIAAYVDAGYTTFDMADHYGSAEQIVGRHSAAGGGADRLQVLTKWVPRPGPLSAADVREAVERALKRLDADHIDLLQFHTWNYADPRWLDALFWLEDLKRVGLIRHLGVTNFDTAHLRVALASGIDIASNQVCCSLLDRRATGLMAELCARHGVALLAYGTLAGGLLTGRWLGREEPACTALGTWSEMKYKRFVDSAGGWERLQHLLGVLDDVARGRGVTIANVACRWVLDQPAVAGIIVGARLGESEHIRDNGKVFEFALDDASRNAIAAAVADLEPIPGDCGDEYRTPPFLTASGDLSDHLEDMPPPYAICDLGDGHRRVHSGTEWETFAGYSRAVQSGNTIHVSGTTATHGERLIGGTDAAAQTHFAIDKIEGALQTLGARLNDVVRTRIFVSDVSDWESVARAHGARFGAIRPANSLVQARLIGPQYLVEIEAEAIVRK